MTQYGHKRRRIETVSSWIGSRRFHNELQLMSTPLAISKSTMAFAHGKFSYFSGDGGFLVDVAVRKKTDVAELEAHISTIKQIIPLLDIGTGRCVHSD